MNTIYNFTVFLQSVTLTYYNAPDSPGSASGNRYYNNGNVANPTFTLSPASLPGWTFRGWATSSSATAGIAYSSISNTAFSSSVTVYAAYSQTITLSYNGNGSTSGSTTEQTGTRYWNTGNVSNPSFTLRSNGFSRSGHNFVKWALGSASGTQYTTGASVTLSANATFYAVWKAAEESKYLSNTSIEKNNTSLQPHTFSNLFGEIGNGATYRSVTVTIEAAYGEEFHENQWFDLGVNIVDESNTVRNYALLGRVSSGSPVSVGSRTVTITIPNENRSFFLCGGSSNWSGAGVGYVKVKISNPVKLTRR